MFVTYSSQTPFKTIQPLLLSQFEADGSGNYRTPKACNILVQIGSAESVNPLVPVLYFYEQQKVQQLLKEKLIKKGCKDIRGFKDAASLDSGLLWIKTIIERQEISNSLVVDSQVGQSVTSKPLQTVQNEHQSHSQQSPQQNETHLIQKNEQRQGTQKAPEVKEVKQDKLQKSQLLAQQIEEAKVGYTAVNKEQSEIAEPVKATEQADKQNLHAASLQGLQNKIQHSPIINNNQILQQKQQQVTLRTPTLSPDFTRPQLKVSGIQPVLAEDTQNPNELQRHSNQSQNLDQSSKQEESSQKHSNVNIAMKLKYQSKTQPIERTQSDITNKKVQESVDNQFNNIQLQQHSSTLNQRLIMITQLEQNKTQDNVRTKKLAQKKKLMEDLKKINKEINQLKPKNSSPKNDRKQQHQIFVSTMQAQRKRIQEVKKKLILKNKKLQEENRRRHDQMMRQKQAEKEIKKMSIKKRLEKIQIRKNQRISLDREANRLISQLKGIQTEQKKKNQLVEEIEQQVIPSPPKKKIDFQEIKLHQQKYMDLKHQLPAHPKPLPKMPIQIHEKTKFGQLVQEEDLRRKSQAEAQRAKIIQKVQKRNKYSELIKQAFVFESKAKKSFKEEAPKVQSANKPPKQPLPVMPQKKKTVRQILGKPQYSPSQKMMNKSKMSVSVQSQKSQSNKIVYKDYLKDMRSQSGQRRLTQNWKNILKKDKLTEDQKFSEIVKRAHNMENMARIRQTRNGQKDQQQAVDLYMESIQAKLALLQLKK